MIYSTGVCKSFPPPLVRGGVFEVGLETKYRDIADGNQGQSTHPAQHPCSLETKYRDIADGNYHSPQSASAVWARWKPSTAI